MVTRVVKMCVNQNHICVRVEKQVFLSKHLLDSGIPVPREIHAESDFFLGEFQKERILTLMFDIKERTILE